LLGAFAAMNYAGDMQRVAAKHHLSSEEASAYSACASDVRGKSFRMTSQSGGMSSNKVPEEICVCQARWMVQVFRQGQYGGHRQVAEYIVAPRNDRKLAAEDLKPGQSSEVAFAALTQSLSGCMKDYSAEFLRQSEKLKAEGRDAKQKAEAMRKS